MPESASGGTERLKIAGWCPAWSGQPSVAWDVRESDTLVALAATVQGSYHGLKGIPREDAYAIRPIGRDSVVVAVADGVGSTSASRLAANTVVEQFTTAVAESAVAGSTDWQSDFRNAIQSSQAALRELDQNLRQGVPVPGQSVLGRADIDRRRDTGTTLAAAHITWTPNGLECQWMVVGDSECLQISSNGNIANMSHQPSDRGRDRVDSVSGDRPLRERHGFNLVPPGGAVLLASDGELDSHLQSRRSRMAQLALSDSADRIGKLIELLTTDVPGSMDDATLVVVGDGRRRFGRAGG